MDEITWLVIAMLLMDLMLIIQGIRLNKISQNVKKGNKDQQEIKTRLFWMKRSIKLLKSAKIKK